MAQNKVLVTLLVALVMLAQSRDGMVLARHCRLKCLIQCIGVLEDPAAYAACVGLCMTACNIKPSDAVMACATSCTNNARQTYHPGDSKTMKGLVDSCYNSCEQKN